MITRSQGFCTTLQGQHGDGVTAVSSSNLCGCVPLDMQSHKQYIYMYIYICIYIYMDDISIYMDVSTSNIWYIYHHFMAVLSGSSFILGISPPFVGGQNPCWGCWNHRGFLGAPPSF